MSAFTKLGRRIAQVQDADRVVLQATERSADSFIQGLRRRRRRRRPIPLFLAAALAFVALPLLVRMVVLRATRPLIESPSGAVDVGRSIVVPTDQSIPLRFADGSQLVLASGARASVRELSSHQVSLEMEAGSGQFSVIHHADTSWVIRAGVYQVRVTGTRFGLEWSPEEGRFALELEQGSVVVSAANSSHAAVRMVAPEHLVIERGVWQLNPLRDAAASPSSEERRAQPASSGSEPRPNPRHRSGVARRPTATPASPAAEEDWRSLGKLGKFAEAYTVADREGLEHLSQSASAAELLELAEICRFSGHASQGIQLLTAIRFRFPEREDSAVAAFQLGRLLGSGQPAAEWFRTYLRERPSGALAREASARLLEVLDRAGDRNGAAAAAEEYLRRYPSGPHAAFARQLLGH